jgi:hypothetical protein
MSNTKTGGPAFPFGKAYAGMTLRDYFAAQSLPSIMSDWYASGDMPGDGSNADSIAQIAYRMADAMLKARDA